MATAFGLALMKEILSRWRLMHSEGVWTGFLIEHSLCCL